MKKQYFIAVVLFCFCGTLWAQWLSNGPYIFNANGNNVGILTPFPDRPLTILGTGGISELLSLKNNAGVTQWHVNLLGNGLNIAQSGVADGRFFIHASGNIGIGTLAPIDKLHISGGNIRMDSNYELIFADNGQIRSYDNNHRILFRRSEDKMELREYGDIIFSPGAVNGLETARMFLSGNGNIGIGTIYPRGKLDVVGGDIYLSENPYTGTAQSIYIPGHIYISPYAGTNISYLQARRPNNAGTTSLRLRTYNNGVLMESMHIEGNGNVGIGTTAPQQELHVVKSGENADLRLQQAGSDYTDFYSGNTDAGVFSYGIKDLRFGTNGTDRLRITSDGNVGIGTITPQQELHIVKSGENADLRLQRTGSDYTDFYSGDTDAGVFSYGIKDLRFGTNGIDRLRITSDGNVGIGTTTPDAALAVKGHIHTQEVLVDLNGAVAPDFVFEPGYKLRTLAETERYINEHKHLPEIPSAAEIEATGMELKTMSLKLLQKIEELTLYSIEQEKALKQQQEEIQILKKENQLVKSLSERLSQIESQLSKEDAKNN